MLAVPALTCDHVRFAQDSVTPATGKIPEQLIDQATSILAEASKVCCGATFCLVF